MSKRVQYKNGFVGFASDKVAAILEKKGAAKIVAEAPAPKGEEKPKGDEKPKGAK